MGIIFTVSVLVFTVGLMSGGVLGTLNQGESGSSAPRFQYVPIRFQSSSNWIQSTSHMIKDATYKSMVKYLEMKVRVKHHKEII